MLQLFLIAAQYAAVKKESSVPSTARKKKQQQGLSGMTIETLINSDYREVNNSANVLLLRRYKVLPGEQYHCTMFCEYMNDREA